MKKMKKCICKGMWRDDCPRAGKHTATDIRNIGRKSRWTKADVRNALFDKGFWKFLEEREKNV